MTGFFRSGSCDTDEYDLGSHVVCAVVTDEFLAYTRDQGNDLITPQPHMSFPGLTEGDTWCLCAMRWEEARLAGVAPSVVLEATHEKALDAVSLDDLKAHAVDKSR